MTAKKGIDKFFFKNYFLCAYGYMLLPCLKKWQSLKYCRNTRQQQK